MLEYMLEYHCAVDINFYLRITIISVSVFMLFAEASSKLNLKPRHKRPHKRPAKSIRSNNSLITIDVCKKQRVGMVVGSRQRLTVVRIILPAVFAKRFNHSIVIIF